MMQAQHSRIYFVIQLYEINSIPAHYFFSEWINTQDIDPYVPVWRISIGKSFELPKIETHFNVGIQIYPMLLGHFWLANRHEI